VDISSSQIGSLILLLAIQSLLRAIRAILIRSRWERDEGFSLSPAPAITRLSVSLDLALTLVAGLYFIVGFKTFTPVLLNLSNDLFTETPTWFSWIVYGVLLLGLGWFNLTFGTLATEAIGHTFAQQWHEWANSVSQVLHYIIRPLSMSALHLGNALAKTAKADPLQRFVVITEEEIKSLVTVGEQEGIIEEEAREMIYSIFRLGTTITREIMVPRIDVMAIEINTPLENALEAVISSGHSRIPVYAETIDNIIGILHAKDLLLQCQQEGKATAIRKEHLRPTYFVPESKRVDSLLNEMQGDKVQLAIVVDEYGGTAGIVTLEDIVEEIVGEIQDEYDREEPEAILQEDGAYLFEARIPLDDVQDIFKIPLPLEEADSLSGFIYNRLGHVPMVGERVVFDNIAFEVTEITGRRIRKVRAARINNDTDER